VVATSVEAPAKLQGVSPAADDILNIAPTEIVIASANAIDTTFIQTGALQVLRSGDDGSFEEGNETPIPSLTVSVRSEAPTVLVLTKTDGPFVPDSYRITIAGNGALAAVDRAGLPIDGDGDGAPGGDFVEYFDVGREL
jgi:hypothetical protein